MRSALFSACALLCSTSALAQVNSDIPTGRLPDAATPQAYRLDLTLRPDQPRFSGHVEIDVEVRHPLRQLYMHGKDLQVSRAVAQSGGRRIAAAWREVGPTGVVRLDFDQPLPAGKATLVFDYAGAYRDNPTGLYHVKVGDRWYGWSHFEPIDARRAFPAFDQPGYKTPFTISIATPPGEKAVSNTPELNVVRSGGLDVHHFQTTAPLPTYLVALYSGPFAQHRAVVPPDAQRPAPLPISAVAAQPFEDRLDYVNVQTADIVPRLEDYFGDAFPYPKLDQVGASEIPGAMENAGADLYGAEFLLIGADAPPARRKIFGEMVAHELSHQWFGDLVTPKWWDDLWLNESFANWMGYRIGGAWGPGLHLGLEGLAEGFGAMDTDALEVGRPIHGPVPADVDIQDAFDSVTYGKGAQVVGMIAAYMGDDAFRSGVRLHLSRHRYGAADSDQFFEALAEAAHDPRVVAAMRSFTDQPGVPLVTLVCEGDAWRATQSRYSFLESEQKAERWLIPLCWRVEATRRCTLMDQGEATLSVPRGAYVMPNAGGTGYYRFELAPADWDALIAALPSLPESEALAVDDSLWASFRAGRASARQLVAEARALLANPGGEVELLAGQHFAALRRRGLIAPEAAGDYRRVMGELYRPRLEAVGFDPAAGVYAKEPADRQDLRQSLVRLLAVEARDEGVSGRLGAAASAYLEGKGAALDPAFFAVAFTAYVRAGGIEAARRVMNAALSSQDEFFRGSALQGVAGAGRADVAAWALGFGDASLRPTDRFQLVGGVVRTAETRDLGVRWLIDNYGAVSSGLGGILAANMSGVLGAECSRASADEIDRVLGARLDASSGRLQFARTLESIRHCSDLKAARGGELTAAFAAR